MLLLGDCLELLKTLKDDSIDAIITDLPYGTTNCRWDSVIDLPKLWEQYNRVCKKTIVLFAAQPFTSVLIASNLKKFKYCWYWVKEQGTGFLNAKRQPLRVVEEICIFNSGIYNPQMTLRDKPIKCALPIKQSQIYNGSIKSIDQFNGEKEYIEYKYACPKNLLHFKRDKNLIPTQKPLALVQYLVETYTKQGDTVLDSCMGSGTTGLACKNLGRNFIGMELNKDHFEIAEKRINGNVNEQTTVVAEKTSGIRHL